MFQCVHFWGWRALESSADHSDAAAPKEMTGFQMTLCSVLVRKLRQGPPQGLGASSCDPARHEVLRPALSDRKRMQTKHPSLRFMLKNVRRGETTFNNRFYLTE